jgi:DNA-directed RNA polymerase specialized sigma24 family protein
MKTIKTIAAVSLLLCGCEAQMRIESRINQEAEAHDRLLVLAAIHGYRAAENGESFESMTNRVTQWLQRFRRGEAP